MKILLKSTTCGFLACSVLFGISQNKAIAQGSTKLPPVATYQAILDANKKTGWVSFRNFNGKQLLYFSALQTLHCRLREIRYSINSDDLDKRFELVLCNPYTPFSLPSDVTNKNLLLEFPLGSVKYVAVQVLWKDGRESETVAYTPCPGVGETNCSAIVE